MNREDIKLLIDTNITNQFRDDSISPHSLGEVLHIMTDELALKGEVPDPEPPPVNVNPPLLGISIADGYDRIPMANSARDGWVNGGIVASANVSTSTSSPYSSSIVMRRFGRILGVPAQASNELPTLGQVETLITNSDSIKPDNSGTTLITNSTQSLILKSTSSKVEVQPVASGQRNLILGSVSSQIIGGTDVTPVRSNTIIGSSSSIIDTGFNNSIIATAQGTIGKLRQNTAIIACNNVTIEDWSSTTTHKWCSAAIASRLGRIQTSNSYTLVTGKATTSSGSAQFVCGQNNIEEASRSVDDPLKKAFIVGNGTGNDAVMFPPPAVRSNAFYVTQGGLAWVQNGFEIENGGLTMTDTVTGTKYRLTIANGELSLTAI